MLDDPHKHVSNRLTVFTEKQAWQQRSDQCPEDAQPSVDLIPLLQDLLHIEVEAVEFVKAVRHQALKSQTVLKYHQH